LGSDFGDYTAHMASLVNLCAQCDIKNRKFILGSKIS